MILSTEQGVVKLDSGLSCQSEHVDWITVSKCRSITLSFNRFPAYSHGLVKVVPIQRPSTAKDHDSRGDNESLDDPRAPKPVAAEERIDIFPNIIGHLREGSVTPGYRYCWDALEPNVWLHIYHSYLQKGPKHVVAVVLLVSKPSNHCFGALEDCSHEAYLRLLLDQSFLIKFP